MPLCWVLRFFIVILGVIMLSVVMLSVMTFTITIFNAKVFMRCVRHFLNCYSGCCSPESSHPVWRTFLIVMLSVVIRGAVMLNVLAPNKVYENDMMTLLQRKTERVQREATR